VQALDLPPLDISGVKELLARSGAPTDVLGSRPEIVAKLYELADGEPLLLRLYIETLWQEGDKASRITIEELNGIKPGLAGYFEDWLDRQRLAWNIERQHGAQIDEGTVLAHLAVLACVYGPPLTSEELSELVRRTACIPPTFRIEDALYPLRRFVIGTGRRSQDKGAGYVLSHPKFGEFLRGEYFDEKQIRKVQECCANWGREVLGQLNTGRMKPEDAPPYLLPTLAQHFSDIGPSVRDVSQFAEGVGSEPGSGLRADIEGSHSMSREPPWPQQTWEGKELCRAR
jgi:hypothetical protein